MKKRLISLIALCLSLLLLCSCQTVTVFRAVQKILKEEKALAADAASVEAEAEAGQEDAPSENASGAETASVEEEPDSQEVTPSGNPEKGSSFWNEIRQVDGGYSIGTTDGNTYRNEFFGIACTLDDSWDIADRSSLSEMGGILLEQWEDTDYFDQMQAYLDSGSFVYDFYATSADRRNAVQVVLQKLTDTQVIVHDEQKIISSIYYTIPEVYAQQGIDNVDRELGTISVAGIEHPAVFCHYKDTLFDMHNVNTVIKNGSYICQITVNSYMKDKTSDIMALFTAP